MNFDTATVQKFKLLNNKKGLNIANGIERPAFL